LAACKDSEGGGACKDFTFHGKVLLWSPRLITVRHGETFQIP
jgi:hypothetical protein